MMYFEREFSNRKMLFILILITYYKHKIRERYKVVGVGKIKSDRFAIFYFSLSLYGYNKS